MGCGGFRDFPFGQERTDHLQARRAVEQGTSIAKINEAMQDRECRGEE